MKKKVIGLLVVLVVVLGGVWGYAKYFSQDQLFAGPARLTVYQGSVKALIQLPFIKDSARSLLDVYLDLNDDGKYEDQEQVIKNGRVSGVAGKYSGYYFVMPETSSQITRAKVVLAEKSYELEVETLEMDTSELLGMGSVTDPENAMKGLGIAEVFAQSEPIEIVTEGVPDLNQRVGECAPTAAANSLISLVAKNGGEDLVPGDPVDFIQNLKQHMNWTPENGVLPDDFVQGKNAWAAAAGVPIRTVKVGDKDGITTIEAIRDALAKGGAVELRLKFADENLNAEGGHMVTVTGIHQGEGQTYLDINDPVTANSGTETVEIRGNQIVNYGPWEGVAVLSWGFVQTWEGHPTGELLDPMSDAEIQGIREFVGEETTIKVIEYQGKLLPVDQLVVQNEEGCGANHWHSARGGVVTATDGTRVTDPGPQCGFGKVKDFPSRDYTMPSTRAGEAVLRGGIFGE